MIKISDSHSNLVEITLKNESLFRTSHKHKIAENKPPSSKQIAIGQ